MDTNKYINDKNLIKEIKNGSDKALNRLFIKYIGCMDGIIISRNGSKEDAREMYNEALFIVYKNAQSGKLDNYKGNSLLPYIRRIGTICFYKKLRKLKQDREQPKDPVELKHSKTDRILNEFLEGDSKEELLNNLDHSISQLKSTCKSLIRLHYLDGFTDDELLEILEYNNTNTIKSARYRCKKKLEKIFSERIQNSRIA